MLQLYFKHGEFWQAVEKARGRLGREGKVGTVHHGGKYLSAVLAKNDLDWSELGNETRASVFEEMAKLYRLTVPHTLRDEILQREWADFLVLCILYDPPTDELVEFAEYGGPTWVFSGGKRDVEEQKRGAAPPVRVVRDPFETEIQRLVQISKVLDEIEKAHPEIRAWDLIEEKGLLEQFRVEMEGIPRRLHIEVGEDTTAKDVTDAYRAIRRIQGEQNRGGASVRDPLIAVQCAVLYDQHNPPDPSDRRRRPWTYKKLAERFGLRSGRAAKSHVELGREIFGKKRVQ